MQLKEYQQKVLERVSRFLGVLKEKHTEAAEWAEFRRSKGKTAAPADYCGKAWEELNQQRLIPWFRDKAGNTVPAGWLARHDGLGREIPNVCLKIPTGGGKTLLAAHALERISVDYFARQTGLVLWIVPSDSIYKQTWKLLANRESIYRQVLERASGGRVMLLEKGDSFTKQDTAEYLCVMLLMLQSSARKSKETLRMFRDSGNFTSFFPEVDDMLANQKLADAVPNLDVNNLADGTAWAGTSLKHSLGNALRLTRPIVVMDEGHKAYSKTARETLDGFNPRFILELSATPNTGPDRQSNILVDVSGRELKEEQMIKLPINVFNYANADWKHALAQAHARLADLQKEATGLHGRENRLIRPIMLVRVERTGKEQRENERIHAEDAREYLIDRCGVKPEEIRVKSASNDELKDEDLLSPLSTVRYIITKDALREGWDCPFAYVLAILDRTSAATALTQMIGRVLRQPEARNTSVQALNECFIFCFDQEVQQAVDAVRRGLEEEGMSDLGSEIRAGNASNGSAVKSVTIQRKDKYRNLGIFLPRVLVKEKAGAFRPIDYDRDMLGALDWKAFSYTKRDSCDLEGKDSVEETLTLMDLGQGSRGEMDYLTDQETTRYVANGEVDLGFLVRQLLDAVPNPWEAARIIDETVTALRTRGFSTEQIYVNRLALLKMMKEDIARQVEGCAEKRFVAALKAGDITLELVSAGDPNLNWELADSFTVDVADGDRVLQKRSGEPLERLLFEKVFEKEFNQLEKELALYVDGDDAVRWWHRLVARQDYHLQGWQRNRIYPDFLVCLETVEGGNTRFSVLETKGKHLKGNDDTDYKNKLFNLLTEHAKTAVRAGDLELRWESTSICFKMLLETTWRDEIREALRLPS